MFVIVKNRRLFFFQKAKKKEEIVRTKGIGYHRAQTFASNVFLGNLQI